ncbi:chemotaxis protein CheB [Psychromonas sp. psych-6C06]|uniref:chemotaxis protein CheB n=1 Tax=Psychromonas sp. psych-6C06 TaxID=2058089 RepID=UPI000C33BEA7|nr:chemotaxis protein CheB [Psychromonas sp. psych-6C06]PKF62589.1 chemotaxis protein CheB [Psychromonas sp. psych-6C06]
MIGVSAGGLQALTTIIPSLPANFPIPIVIVQHRKHSDEDYLTPYLDERSELKVVPAVMGLKLQAGFVYIAPSGYHLLIERDATFALSIDQPVNYSRPSIDLLFDSAAICYQHTLIGLILTGANSDGSQGLKNINLYHGLSLVQHPESAEYPAMPLAALEATKVDYIISLPEIAKFLTSLLMSNQDAKQPK